MVMATRLPDTHPHQKIFTKAMDQLARAGVQIEFLGIRTLVTIKGVTYDLEDLEDSGQVSELPPVFAAKLVSGRD